MRSGLTENTRHISPVSHEKIYLDLVPSVFHADQCRFEGMTNNQADRRRDEVFSLS